jgi:hypothetical protein
MARMKPVLGRGLASLIPRQAAIPPLPVGGQDDGVSNDIIASIALDRIQRTNPGPNLSPSLSTSSSGRSRRKGSSNR